MVVVNSEREYRDLLLATNAIGGMKSIIKYCKNHPTCDNCQFKIEKKGCYFRNKLPREWEYEFRRDT